MKKTLTVVAMRGGFYIKTVHGEPQSEKAKVQVEVVDERIMTNFDMLMHKVEEFLRPKESTP